MSQSARTTLATIAAFYRRVQWTPSRSACCGCSGYSRPSSARSRSPPLLGWPGAIRWSRLGARAVQAQHTAVILVFSAMSLLLLVAAVILVPMLEQQIVTLVHSLPGYRDWFVGTRAALGSNNAPAWRSCPGSIPSACSR